ncbi:MAG: hypothetical protein M3154_11380, partial [Candidatus Eremiobacteraeota bacterium]|nr:hypothetical protein [Candidatus Eremiobacteraeota bacterium]
MTSGRDRVTQPLRDLATSSPNDLFRIVIRIVLDPDADPAASMAAAPAIMNQVVAAIVALVPGAQTAVHGPNADRETIFDDNSTSTAVLNAALTGQHVLDLDAKLPPELPIEFRRQRVKPSDDADVFDPGSLIGRVIAEPLSSEIGRDGDKWYDVIIVLDSGHAKGRQAARDNVVAQIETLRSGPQGALISYDKKENASHPYLFARLTGAQVLALATLDRHPKTGKPAIFRIWEDTEVKALISKSVATVKADAAQIAFSAVGKGIVWAVLDSGVDVGHPHFRQHRNLELRRPVRHRYFTEQRA